jgi:hypothetical protein
MGEILLGEVQHKAPVVKISHFVENPEAYGVCAVMPQPDTTRAPLEPFRVVWSEIKPQERYGVIHRDMGDSRNPSDRELMKGDMILHVNTGVHARVVERIRKYEYRIEAWSGPRTDEDKQAWLINEGKGDWVCWGQSFETVEELPWHEPEVMDTGEKIELARKEMFRYPERQGWAGKFHVGKNWKQLSRKERKRARAQMRGMLGTCRTLQERDPNEVMEENVVKRYKTKLGNEVVHWVMGADGSPEPANG